MSARKPVKLREPDDGNDRRLRESLDEIACKIVADNSEIVNALMVADFVYSDVIDHPLFIRIRSALVEILQKPNGDSHLLCGIGKLFCQLAEHINEKNVHLFLKLFGDETTVKCLSQSLGRLSPTSNVDLIDGMSHIINAYERLEKCGPVMQNDPLFYSLMMAVVDFVKSEEYERASLQLWAQQDELTSFQNLILVTCPDYIVRYYCDYYDKISSALAEEVLNRSSKIIRYLLPSLEDWKEPVIRCMHYFVSLCQYCAGEHLLSKFKVRHEEILDCVLTILHGHRLWRLVNDHSSTGSLHRRAHLLFSYATLYVYTMAFLPELRDQLQKRNTASLLIRLTQVNFEATKFHAYRALAAILTDEDIKQLNDPAEITTVFITYMKRCTEMIKPTRRLENLLRSLKNLIQHDQIKVEFVRQVEGLPLLILCATQSRFDPLKVQTFALEILLVLSIDGEAKALLQQNTTFIQDLKTMISTSDTPGQRKAADGILWQLFLKHQKAEYQFQYDVMISYSHKDKDVCHRIHKALTDSKFRVWIDLEGMHGAMMQVMADAVKRSRCILICMSESYYLSPYCQAEAQYGFDKQRVLIPIKVQSGYKPDGWLEFVTACRMYVDFTKTDFDTAYTKVVSEITHSEAVEKESSSMASRTPTSKGPTIKSEQLTTSSDQRKQPKSHTDPLNDDMAQNNTETSKKLSSLEAHVTDLQTRVDQMESHFAKINDSLNWIMTAMARVKMAKEDPPYIKNPKRD